MEGFYDENFVFLGNEKIDMKIFHVEMIYKMNNLIGDGILGLNFNRGENEFLNSLFISNKINKKIFSFHLNEKNNNFIKFGENEIKKDFICWQEILKDEFLWSFEKKKILIGKKVIYEENFKIIIDSGAPGIFLPKNLLGILIKELDSNKIKCNILANLLFCQLENIFKKPDFSKINILSFFVNDKEIFITLDYFVFNSEKSLTENGLIFNIVQKDGNDIFLGIPVFKKYDVFFDYSGKIGFYEKNNRKVYKYNQTDLQVNIFKFLFVFLLSFILTHFMILGIKSCYEIRLGFNYFELGFLD